MILFSYDLVFKLAVHYPVTGGRAELLRTEITGRRLLHLSFFRILKLLCYFATYGFFVKYLTDVLTNHFFDELFDEHFDNEFFDEIFDEHFDKNFFDEFFDEFFDAFF
jgi:hypothetical protein